MNKMRKLILITILLFASLITANPLSWQTFSNGKNIYISSGNQLYSFSGESKLLSQLILDQNEIIDTIDDIVNFENYLYFSTNAGIYQFDMSSQAIEKIVFNDNIIRSGKIASDIDYLWLCTSDTLFRFDKLGREWQPYPLPEQSIIKVIQSDSKQIDCFTETKLNRFDIVTERWNTTSTSFILDDSVNLLKFSGKLIALKGNNYLYHDKTFNSWNNTELPQQIVDIFPEQKTFLACATTVYKIEDRILKRVDLIQNDSIISIAKSMDTLFIANLKRLIKFDINTNRTVFIEYPQGFNTNNIKKIIVQNTSIILFSDDAILIYDSEKNIWNTIVTQQNKKNKRVAWNDNGLQTQFVSGYKSVLKGQFESMASLKTAGFEKDTNIVNGNRKIDSTMLVVFALPNYIADVNLHITDPKDRYADIYFNNSNTSVPPQKHIYYKGLTTDYLQSLQLGTTNSNFLQSPSLPPVQFEGGQTVLASSKKLSDKDRNIFKAGAGLGFITSQTKWLTLAYRSDGKYVLKDTSATDTSFTNKDTTQIIPGSVTVYIDGTPLDEKDYTFISETGVLRINRSAMIDPVSLITVSYKTQTIPSVGMERVEIIPEHHFGNIYYGETVLSPVNWFSARTGYIGIKDTSLHSMIHVSTPIELRNNNRGIVLKLTPDVSYNPKDNSNARAISLQSKFGNKFSILFDGLQIDSSYMSTDTISHGYGIIRNEYDGSIGFDPIPETPLTFSSHVYDASGGKETKYSFDGGIHFARFPNFNLNISRTILENTQEDSVNLFDSIFHFKNRIGLRLYETSSEVVQNILKLKKLSYDISHSEYSFTTFKDNHYNSGRRTNASVIIIPIQQLTLLCDYTYSKNSFFDSTTSVTSPSLEFQMLDFPQGVEFSGKYDFYLNKHFASSASDDSLNRSLKLFLHPGQWVKQLRWLSLEGEVKQTITTSYDILNPSIWDVIYSKNNRTSYTDLTGIGVSIFPIDAVLLKNKNEWITDDSTNFFRTSNDFQWQINTKNLFQTTLSYQNTENGVFNCNLLHSYQFTRWLRIQPEIACATSSDTFGTIVNYTPKMTTFLSIESKSKILKSLLNIQSIGTTILKPDYSQSTNDVTYSFMLRVMLNPRIQVITNDIIKWKNGSFDSFSGKLTATLFF